MQSQKGREDPKIADLFANQYVRESGAASAWVRCNWVEEFEPDWYHRCKLAIGHPGDHEYGKQEVRFVTPKATDGQAPAVHV